MFKKYLISKRNIYHWSFRWSFVVKPYENFEGAPQDWHVRTSQYHKEHNAKFCFHFEEPSRWISSILPFLNILEIESSNPIQIATNFKSIEFWSTRRASLSKNERVRNLLSKFKHWGPGLVRSGSWKVRSRQFQKWIVFVFFFKTF